MKKIKVDFPFIIAIVIIAIIFYCITAVNYNVVPLNDIPINFIGAALGALIGGLITIFLLKGQAAVEEKKGKDIQILQEKAKIFKGFIADIWDLWKEQNIKIEKLRKITSTYTDLIIYIPNH
jgi:hypothetical protein